MKPTIPATLLCALACACVAPGEKDFNRELPPGASALVELDDPDDWPPMSHDWYRRDEILPALQRSIEWTDSPYAENFFPIEGITHERALRSLQRFSELLFEARSPQDFGAALQREFTVYQSAGWDGRGGGVLFTGYCTPILDGSLERTASYRYPLFALPGDLVKGRGGKIRGRKTERGIEPYPIRSVIEASGMLRDKGLELVWLRDPLEAFIAHVNGSAFVRLPSGELARFGYAGTNGCDYTSLAKELVAAGRLDPDHSGLASIRAWARENPGEVEEFLGRNERYVFFTPIDGNPHGSLNVEVTGGRSLATDKTLFPRGATVFVETHLPGADWTDGREYHRFLFDQDTGGAIRTAGRADIYLGVGGEAEELAGSTRVEGQLYYLFLRD